MVQPDKQYPSLESVSDLYGRVSSFFEADTHPSVDKDTSSARSAAASLVLSHK
jgi:hypothetical protein